MPSEVASVSLLETLAEPGFRSSVFATYSCYFPFYEDVILRRLMSVGCTHNVLMVDESRCAEAFAADELRPRRAGRDYTLIPVRVGGAFHPKIFLRLGNSKGSLLVGSHNVTLSGFGLNDEVTNVFQFAGPMLRSSAAPLRAALDYLSAFVPAGLPDVLDAYQSLKQGIPWIGGPLGNPASGRMLVTSSPTSPSIWTQVESLIPERVSTAFICGPFFDPSLALISHVLERVRPRQAIIGIDPESVEIDASQAARLAGVRWVNLAGIPPVPHRLEGTSPYLHAKVLWFQGDHHELLISGSANPTVAAFLAPGNVRNAEAIVADTRRGAAEAIGIDVLLAGPPVTVEDWATVTARTTRQPRPETPLRHSIVLASPAERGFLTHDMLPAGLVLDAIGDGKAPLGQAIAQGGTSIEASIDVRDQARYLEHAASQERTVVLVHRTEEIAKNLGGDTRKALRRALGGLEEDPAQLEALLKLTEKVIFESEDVVRVAPLRTPATSQGSKEAAPPPPSLALDAAGRKASRHKKSLASGDIVVLLDALIRRLGEGLPANTAPRPPNDQDQIGSDEEDGGELARNPPDLESLAKACQAKARRLISRMKGQFVVACAPGMAHRCIVQLAAVLGVLRTLRVVGQRAEWRRMSLELVTCRDLFNMFEAAVLAVAWNDKGLAPRAVQELDGEPFEELSMVAGLMEWLAWELQVDAVVASRDEGRRGVENDSWYAIQLMAALAPWTEDDDVAEAIATDGVTRTPRLGVDGHGWLADHHGLAHTYAQAVAHPEDLGRVARRCRPGELIILGRSESPRVRVILDVRPSGDCEKAVVFDPGGRNKRRAFVSSFAATLAWAPSSARVIISA